MNSPCHGCRDRTAVPNCHASCERYATFAAERERIRRARELEGTVDKLHEDAVRRMLHLARKKYSAR